MLIEIIDIGMGNVASIKRMYDKLGIRSHVVSHPSELSEKSNIILPGVGNFKAAMNIISENNFKKYLDELVLAQKRPILGICLGMQLLFEYSDEGACEGLSFIKGRVKKIHDRSSAIRVPHMGWNSVNYKSDGFLSLDIKEKHRYYFVHSYYACCADQQDIAGITTYGPSFCSVVNRGNIYGVQFHPEKSHRFGMKILQGFAEL